MGTFSRRIEDYGVLGWLYTYDFFFLSHEFQPRHAEWASVMRLSGDYGGVGYHGRLFEVFLAALVGALEFAF
jgi:hypothetical protein